MNRESAKGEPLGVVQDIDAATDQWNIILPTALTMPKAPPVTVWAKQLPAGRNDLDLG